MPRTPQVSDCSAEFVPMDLSLPSWHPLRSLISLAAPRPALPSNTRPLKFQIRRLTGLSMRLVAFCYLFTSQTNAFQMEKNNFLSNPRVDRGRNDSCDFEKSSDEMKTRGTFVKVHDKIERTLGISITQVVA